MNDVIEKVNEIKGRKYTGSNTRDAKLYHELPFEEFKHFNRHRGGTQERIDNIIRLVNVKDKTILDLGCSVGGLSFGMAQKGAKYVTGIDYDTESIGVANAVKEHYKIENIDFLNDELTIERIRELPKVDIVIWMSQWMWIVKQKGMDYAKDLLFEVSAKADIMVFESAANDGMARIKGATQDDIEKWLFENTCYEKITRYGSTGGWMNRSIFLCTHPLLRIESTRRAASSIITRLGRDRVKKAYRTYPKDCRWMCKREAKALRMLEKYDHYPKLIEEGEDYIIMNFVGRRNQVKFTQMKFQADDILKELKRVGLTHRDLVRKNYLAMNNNLYLIDFGWCVFADEDIAKARGHRNLPKGTDEEQIKASFG